MSVPRALVADQAVPDNLASTFDGTRLVVLLLQEFKHRLERVCFAPLGHLAIEQLLNQVHSSVVLHVARSWLVHGLYSGQCHFESQEPGSMA